MESLTLKNLDAELLLWEKEFLDNFLSDTELRVKLMSSIVSAVEDSIKELDAEKCLRNL